MDYDTGLFIEIIESTQGVSFLRHEFVNGIHIRHYEGINGRHVMIDTTDEFIPSSTCKGYLRKLGLDNLIPMIFPELKTPNS